jgi:type I restriction enzyme S subunit
MKRYEKYKPTGIQWLPEIPEYWEAVKIKYCFNQRSEKGFPNEPILCATQSRGVIPQTLYENRVVVVNKGFEGLKLVKVGDFVISLRSFQGGIEYAYYQGIISSAYTILSPQKESSSPYFKYLFKSHPFIQLLQTCVTGIREGQNINYSVLGNSFIPIPPIPEQNKIVAYLDKRITLIDNCKCQRERELQTLNELKQAEIASVVTRGLNPDVPMKDSGIPWIGQIPAHWNMIRIKNLLVESKVKSTDGHEQSLSLSKASGIIPYEEKENRTMQSESLIGAKVVHPGDVVFNRFKARLFAISTHNGVVSSDYAVYKGKGRANLNYLVSLFSTEMYRAAFDRKASGIGDGFSRLYTADLFAMYAIFPPIEEQNAIVEYIESKTNKIDTMIEALKAEIDRLTEYKQRLISDVVTGQIDVRGEQIQ